MAEVFELDRLYQDKRTGKRVRPVGGVASKENTVMVRGQDGQPYFVSLGQLVPCAADGTPDHDAVIRQKREEDEKDQAIPEPVIPVVETRLNINTATAEDIARRIPGVGFRIAKQIKDAQMTNPGEVFRTLDQVRAVSNRPNWDAIIEQNLIFVG